MLLNKDLIDDIGVWDPEAAVMWNFNTVMIWLAKQFNIFIKQKKLEIADKAPGAIFGDDPKVIYIKMLCRFEYYLKSS